VQGKKCVGDPIAFTIYRNGQILNLRTISKLFLSIILFASRIVLLFRTAISNRSHIRLFEIDELITCRIVGCSLNTYQTNDLMDAYSYGYFRQAA